MNSIYTERENILPHHAEWLDGCGATWLVFNTKFSTGVNARMGNIIFNGMKQNGFSHAYDPDINYTHIPTGTEFCERVAEILGLPKPTFEVDISKKETTTDHIPYVGQKVDEQDKLFPGRNNTMGEGSLTQEDIEILLGDSIVKPIKGMAIEVSRLGQADREWAVEVRNKLCNWHMWEYCIYQEGRIKLGDVLDKDLTITESPTEFLEYVSKQTGKEYKKTADYDVQKFVANREGMAERLAKAPFTNEELMDLPDEEIGKLNFGKPTYPHKTYRILDSLDGVPLDTRIPLSEWIPPYKSDEPKKWILFISENNFYKGTFVSMHKDHIVIESITNEDVLIGLDGHWMRIV